MSLVTTSSWIVTNLNLVFLNCVLLVVYELKIVDAIRAGAQGATIEGGSGDCTPENFETQNLWNEIFRILSDRLQLITQKGPRFVLKRGAPAPRYKNDMSAQNCAVRSRKTWGHKQPRGPKNLRAWPPESAGALALAQSAPPPINPPLHLNIGDQYQ